MKYVFKSKSSTGDVIIFKSEAVTLSELLEQFRLFLLASGFHVDGYLTIEKEDEA